MIFRIDHRDRVAEVEDDWAALSTETGADHLFPGAVVGKPYRSTISNNQVAEIMRVLLEEVRLKHEPVSFPVRADSARVRRFMTMTIDVVAGGGVEFRLAEDRTEPRPPSDWGPPADEDEILRACTFCHRAQWDFEWLPLPDVIREADLFGAFRNWQVSHGSCKDCLNERLKEIQDG